MTKDVLTSPETGTGAATSGKGPSVTETTALTHDSLGAFDLVGTPVWIVSADDQGLRYANDAARTVLAQHGSSRDRPRAATPDEAGRPLLPPELALRLQAARGQPVRWDLGRAGVPIPVLSRLVRLNGEACILSTVDAAQPHPPQTTEARICQAVETFPARVAILSATDRRILCVTGDYARTLGLGRDDLVGRSLCDLFPTDGPCALTEAATVLAQSLQKVARIGSADVAGVLAYPIRTAEGALAPRDVLVVNRPVADAAGAVTAIAHVVTEVSAPAADPAVQGNAPPDTGIEGLSATVSALRERDLRLGIAESLLGLGTWDCDLATLRLAWSPRVFGMTGRALSDGEPSFDDYVAMTHPDDRDAMRRTFEDFLQSGRREFDFRHRVVRPDGSVAHVRGAARRETVEGREILKGCVLDETEVIQWQTEATTTARLQRIAGRMAKVGGWRYDARAQALEWSIQTARIHDEADGFTPPLDQAIAYYSPEHRARVAETFRACLETGEPFEETFQLVTAKGNLVWVRTSGEAVRDRDGRIVAVEGALQDVSELLNERDRSRAQYRRLRQTLDHISDGFYLLDHDWKFAFLNPEAERLLRRPRESLLGRNVWEEFPTALGTDFERSYRKAMDIGAHVRFEAYSDRLKAWFSVDAHPTPEGLAVYFRDITKARDRDEKLALLAAAVARQNDILLITEAEPIDAPDGPRIVYVNDAFTRRTGHTAAEVLGKTPRLLQGPGTQRAELDRIRAALGRWEPVRAELINYTKSGEEFWVELDIVPLATEEGGRFTHWVSIQRDITARRAAEAALRASEDRFRLVAQATGNAIWDWDIPGNRHWWSEGLTEQFGHPRNPDNAIPSVWEDNLHPEDRDRVLTAQKDLLEGRLASMHETYRFRCADGTWATVEDHAFLIRDAAGRPIRLLGSMNNVTERMHLEDRLRQSQKLEAVGQLTGGIAHDFNNLLTIILGNAEALEDAVAKDHALRPQVEMINVAADRGAELTRRLLAFSRRQTLAPRSLDINALLSDMAPLLRRTLGEHVRVEIVTSPDLWPTEVDAGQLEAAILNLALNARDAMGAGGSLTIETANAPLDDDYAATEVEVEAGNYVVVVVTDTGHGMTQETVARAFEPFFTTKEVGKGSGLGLSMVFGFVKQSGGHVRIYSEPGEGTAVKLYFPRAARPATETRPKPAARHAVGGTETILVVEDEALVREHVVAQLRALGYRVLAANDGPEALSLLQGGAAVDLLFTDVVMPGGIGGRDLAERAGLLRPGLKVLFTSGYTETSVFHQGRLQPGVDLLSKPYRRDVLAAKVRKVLDTG